VPIDVANFTTEVTVADGDLPLSPAQVERLIQAVLKRLDEARRDEARRAAATAIRPRAAPRGGRG
jgi:hypothetical protein